jgi:hypothetical protein
LLTAYASAPRNAEPSNVVEAGTRFK